MFRKSELDDKGDLPAPFSIEKYNFNPLEILGNLKLNPQTLRPEHLPNDLKDKNGKDVNRSGFLVDKDGNLTDRAGRKIFDRRLLGKKDDMPNLLNYRGKKFDVRDVVGDFDRDPEGNAIIKRDVMGGYKDK
mmetsp:Transcript_32745/g.31978  ORF Transcript_32745/g.31978 Transcript_32745/m.31978 type:complete len:132 (-) Transcript_32745:1416-1811(-)